MFGNKLDPDAAVNRTLDDPRNYTVLGFLDNKPRVTYLARIRNPNPNMPNTTPARFDPRLNGSGTRIPLKNTATAGIRWP